MPTSKRAGVSSIILGIDPGYADTGYGVVGVTNGTLSYVTCGTITTSAKQPFPQRLRILSDRLDELIRTYHPTLIAVEKLFFFKNLKTAIDVAQARGVVLVQTAQHDIPLAEYTPLEVKQSITSYGQATKHQVAHMVSVLLNTKIVQVKDDALDALAIAICASFRSKIRQ